MTWAWAASRPDAKAAVIVVEADGKSARSARFSLPPGIDGVEIPRRRCVLGPCVLGQRPIPLLGVPEGPAKSRLRPIAGPFMWYRFLELPR